MDSLRSLFLPELPWWNLLIRGVVVYAAVLVLLRMSGKRQVAQMGLAEFVALLLISNAVQNSMNGGDNSLVGGLILAGTIIILARGFQYATFRSRKFEQLIQGRPRLLIHRGEIIHRNLSKEMLNMRELKMILRRQGIHNLADVEQAVLESDGFVSVTKKTEPELEAELHRTDVRR